MGGTRRLVQGLFRGLSVLKLSPARPVRDGRLGRVDGFLVLEDRSLDFRHLVL